MEKQIFIRNKGEIVTIGMKPNNFLLTGEIVAVYDDCIEFKTNQRTSFLNFDMIASLALKEVF